MRARGRAALALTRSMGSGLWALWALGPLGSAARPEKAITVIKAHPGISFGCSGPSRQAGGQPDPAGRGKYRIPRENLKNQSI